jgi:predicted nucleic acid-binding protein
MCRNVISAAERNQIEIATSTLSFAEVCRDPDLLKNQGEDKIAAYFENDYVLPVNLDRTVGELARALMRSVISLKPPDACHLATAALANVDEMHTFDPKLLDLNGIIDKSDGTKLKICKSDPGGRPAPLLDEIVRREPNE